MTGFGLIATGAALANYQRAKRNYEQIEERSVGVKSVVNRYQELLDEWDYQKQQSSQTKIDTRENDMPDGIHLGSMLRVGNLVGKLMRCEPTVVISNTSDKKYYLFSLDMDIKVYDQPVIRQKLSGLSTEELPNYSYIRQWITTGQTMDIVQQKGISSLVNTETQKADLSRLREAICEAAGKKLITSCPKINLDGIVTADIVLYWSDHQINQTLVEKANRQALDDIIKSKSADALKTFSPGEALKKYYPDEVKTAYWVGMPGVLRYCGEAYL